MKQFLFLLFVSMIYHTAAVEAMNPNPFFNENDTIGIIDVSVANIRYAPSYEAEMATQAILGCPVKILEQKRGWYKVQTPEGYSGWTSSPLTILNKTARNDWETSPKIIYLPHFGFSYSKPDDTAQSVSDLVSGAILKLTGSAKSYYCVAYPDGRTAYIPQKNCMPLEKWKQSRSLTGKNIVNTALTFMGIPYLWGGTSAKGMDCSGFTKTVYFLNGVILKRDASQQITAGAVVDTATGFEQVQPGDLLFFGRKATDSQPEKIIHVAISLGGAEFIHASGSIRLNSLDPNSPIYDDYNHNRFIRAKRMIGHIDNVNIWYINY
jgi:cell wall-associated NlpC family hydrolase